MRRHKRFVEKKQKKTCEDENSYIDLFKKLLTRIENYQKENKNCQKRRKKLREQKFVEKNMKKWFMNTKNVLRYFHVVYISKSVFENWNIASLSRRLVSKSFWKRKNHQFNSKKILLNLYKKKYKEICQKMRRLSTNQILSSQIIWRTRKVSCIF